MNELDDEIRSRLMYAIHEFKGKLNPWELLDSKAIKCLEGKRKFNLEIVTEICQKLRINANWVLLGEGYYGLGDYPVDLIREDEERIITNYRKATQISQETIYWVAEQVEKEPDIEDYFLKKTFNIKE